MKVKPSVKLICKDCYGTRVDGRYVVRCKKNLKHKQRQG